MKPSEIIRAVSIETGVPMSDIRAKCRKSRVVYARTMAMHIIRKLCPGISLSETGAEFGKDHTNVAHTLKRHSDLVSCDASYSTACKSIEDSLSKK